MKRERSDLFANERKWWRSLTVKQKLLAAYFCLSFGWVVSIGGGTPVWMMFLAVLNFGISARLARRVPMDALED